MHYKQRLYLGSVDNSNLDVAGRRASKDELSTRPNQLNNYMQKSFFIILALLLISGCASIGPGRVHMDRGTYNNIVRDTDQEQLLMNIVRERYLEISQYIQIGSLTASYSMSQSLAGNVTATTTSPRVLTSSLSPAVTYSDTPTISYMPLSSTEFAKSLMTPVSMNDFLLLAHAGRYDHTMLFYIFFEQIGRYSADLLNRGGVDHITPQYEKYNKILNLLSCLYRKGAFEAPGAIVFEKKFGSLLRFQHDYEDTPEALKLKQLLGIPVHSKDIIFMEHTLVEEMEEKQDMLMVSHQPNKPRNIVYVKLRSVYAIISLLGRGVQIPCKDIQAHLTRELINPDGSRYDWTAKMKNILTIYQSSKEPLEDVLVKAVVHDHWFYIKASDLASKDTFDAVIRLFTLTSAVAASNNSMPVLTIPVASSGH